MAGASAAHDADRAERAAAATIAGLGFPPPPHRVAGERPAWVVAVATALLGLLLTSWVGLLGVYVLATPSGRALLDDTWLSAGLGRLDGDATVVIGACEARGVAGAGRYALPHRSCPVEVTSGRVGRSATVDLLWLTSLPAPLGAGIVAGRVAVRWSWPVMVGRWVFAMLPLTLMGLAIAAAVPGWRSLVRRRSLRYGHVRPAALLTWSGRPWFAYRDERGRTRFARAAQGTVPLVLDGVRSEGAVLLGRGHAVLIDAHFGPLDLAPAEAETVRVRVTEVQVRSRLRAALAPAPGELPTVRARLARIEGPGASGRDQGERYIEAWRLAWDATEADVAERALVARNDAAAHLGPRRTLAALRACRARSAA